MAAAVSPRVRARWARRPSMATFLVRRRNHAARSRGRDHSGARGARHGERPPARHRRPHRDRRRSAAPGRRPAARGGRRAPPALPHLRGPPPRAGSPRYLPAVPLAYAGLIIRAGRLALIYYAYYARWNRVDFGRPCPPPEPRSIPTVSGLRAERPHVILKAQGSRLKAPGPGRQVGLLGPATGSAVLR